MNNSKQKPRRYSVQFLYYKLKYTKLTFKVEFDSYRKRIARQIVCGLKDNSTKIEKKLDQN